MKQKPRKSLVERLADQPLARRNVKQEFIDGSILPIDISMIEPYYANPRIYENPKFEIIKESIRNRGILQRIVVTKPPNSEKFMLCQGGNTRLRALRELYEETHETRFKTAFCEFREWQGEANLMVGHVVENELRGNLNWHERSKMVLALRGMFEEEKGKEISDREYSNWASEKGITVTRSNLPASRYTMDVLVKTMPNQLKLGLGRRRTEQIYKTDKALRSICLSDGMTEKEYEQLFHTALAEMDERPIFDFDLMCSVMANHFCPPLDTVRSYLMAAVDRYVRVGGDLPTSRNFPKLSEKEQTQRIMEDPSVQATPTTYEINGVELPDNRAPPESRRRPSGEVDTMDGQRLQRKAPAQAERLRGRIFHEATILEMDFGMRGSIVNSHFGYGFYVFYPPSPNSWADAATAAQIWWMLIELSDMAEGITQQPQIAHQATLCKSPLLPWIQTGDVDELLKIANEHGLTPPQPLNTFATLLRSSKPSKVGVVTKLINRINELHKHAADMNLPVWKFFDEQQ